MTVSKYALSLNKVRMFTHTYCNVESNALKFPVFPLDHLLTSASRTSATLCKNKILLDKM